MSNDITKAFREGAAAALDDHSAKRWNNPYVLPLLEAKKQGKATRGWEQKFEAWEEGWDWKIAEICLRTTRSISRETRFSAC